MTWRCPHLNFSAVVSVGRLTDDQGGTAVIGYTTDIRVNCADCGKPFQWLGLEPGVDTQGARVSMDGLEARIAISPQGERPSPVQRLAFNVRKFDG